jgi:selenocysteine lyase/cysteine desulfurase
MTDWRTIRSWFPAIEGRTYLNTATYGLSSRETAQAMIGHLHRRDREACADFLEWFDDLDATRGKCARLIGGEPSGIAFTLNACSALSLLLGGLPWQPGDRVVTLSNEFPNQIYFASLLAARGVEFVEASGEQLETAINDKTKVVAISQVSYTTGFRAPLEQLGPWLRSRGILLYVDATQALGALRFDARAVQPAMVAVNAYKWLLTPNGAAFFYIGPALRDRLPPNVIGWRSHHDWRNVNALHAGAPRFSADAEKYEGGMPAFPSLYAMDASISQFLAIGPERIERRVLELTAELHARLRSLRGATILHEHSPITAVRFDGVDAGALAAELRKRNVIASARHGCLRISLHLYNDESDIDALMTGLRSLLY